MPPAIAVDNSLVHPNPCPTPNVPPIQIELGDIPVGKSHQHYTSAVKVVKAYWEQATNMTADDQQEYKHLLNDKAFIIEESAMVAPSNQRVNRAFKIRPSWAKYIFVHALYNSKTPTLDKHAAGFFNSADFDDETSAYRQYHQDPTSTPKNKKRKTTKASTKTKATTSTETAVATASTKPAVTSPLTKALTAANPPVASTPTTPTNLDSQSSSPQNQPCQSANILSVNAMSQRLVKLEQALTQQRSEYAFQFGQVNDRITLVLDEIIKLRSDVENYSDNMDNVTDRVDVLIQHSRQLLGLPVEEDSEDAILVE